MSGIKRTFTDATKTIAVFKRLKEFSKEHPRFTNTVIYGSTGTFGAEFFQQTLLKKILVSCKNGHMISSKGYNNPI